MLTAVAGQNYSVRCVASNMIPDGLFVWRLEEVTLTNHRPLLSLNDGEGWRTATQEIVLHYKPSWGFCSDIRHIYLEKTSNVYATFVMFDVCD